MKQLFVCWLLLASYGGMAQGEFTTWRFGDGFQVGPSGRWEGGWGIALEFKNGIILNKNNSYIAGGYDTARTSTAWFTAGASASISDAAGNPLFYSIGGLIRDRRNNPMPHGGLYTPDYFTQTLQLDGWWYEMFWTPPVIAPGPDGLYYAFYWTKTKEADRLAYALTYCVVDMRLNGGYGDVTRAGLVLNRTFQPRMTLVRHRNNRDFWVITRDLDTRGFEAFLLTRSGVSPQPVVSLAGQANYADRSDLVAAPNGQRLACGLLLATAGGEQRWGMGVYDFDNATGRVGNEQVVRQVASPPFSHHSTGQPSAGWDGATAACFSPNSRLLYTCETDFTLPLSQHRWSDVWQYDLGQPSLAAIAQSRYLVSNVPQLLPPEDGFGGSSLQLAPDSTVWVNSLYPGEDPIIPTPVGQGPAFRPLTSAIIRHPDVPGAGCALAPRGYVHRPGLFPDWGHLPAVVTNMLYAPPALNYEQGCAADSVQFWASSVGLPAGLRWDFGDPGSGPANTASGGQVAHRYAQGGHYPVRLILADGRVLTRTVTVTAQAVDFTDANVFTPNGDGLNDEFVPVRQPLPGGRLQVFGRWGQLIYSTDDPALRWNGAGATGGEYFYSLEYTDCLGARRRRRGIVTLVR